MTEAPDGCAWKAIARKAAAMRPAKAAVAAAVETGIDPSEWRPSEQDAYSFVAAIAMEEAWRGGADAGKNGAAFLRRFPHIMANANAADVSAFAVYCRRHWPHVGFEAFDAAADAMAESAR